MNGKINVVRKEGGSRVLAMSKVLPPNWVVVEMGIVKSTPDTIIVKITKVK